MFETEYKAVFSHVTASEDTYMRIMRMTEERKDIKHRKHFRLILIAAVLVSAMLLVGAYSGYVLYERPQEMLEALMGVNGRSTYASQEITVLYQDGNTQLMQTPSGTRTELDMKLAKKWLAPYIYQVGERIVDGETVLTAEACLVERATHTGALYLKLENSPEYQVTNRGQVWWLDENGEFFYYPKVEMIGEDYFLSSFLIADEMTEQNTLAVILMFTCGKGSEGMRLTAGDSGDSISIPFPEETGMKVLELAEGKIILSPFGALLDSGSLGIRFWTYDVISILYKNGEEYLLQWEDPAWKPYEEEPKEGVSVWDSEKRETWENLEESISNSNFSVFLDEENSSVVYIFNRVLDLEEVKAVVINGIEYPVE